MAYTSRRHPSTFAAPEATHTGLSPIGQILFLGDKELFSSAKACSQACCHLAAKPATGRASKDGGCVYG